MVRRVHGDSCPGLRDELRSTAREYFELGRAALPQVALSYEEFERYFVGHGGRGSAAYARDMYLACACAQRIDAALGLLERTLTNEVASAVVSIDSSPTFVEEVLQATRRKLLMAGGGKPARIATYAGLASLKSWLCAVAVRTALSQRRRKSAHGQSPLDDEREEPLARGGPEIEYLRRRYKDAFEGAVRTAIERLTDRERLFLRLNVIDRLSVDQLGAMYKVGRSTAARWLAAAKRALVEHTRCELQRQLGLGSTELDSLAVELRSQLDVSVRTLLGGAEVRSWEGAAASQPSAGPAAVDVARGKGSVPS